MLENIVLRERDIQDLKELIWLTVSESEEIKKFMNLKTNVRHGNQLGFIGEMQPVGSSGSGCNPEYSKFGINNSSKRWSLGEWNIAKELCYKELEGTIAELALKKGTDIADITGTQFAMEILTPALEEAVKKMVWRLVYFGDKNAQNIADGGVITNGVDVNLMNVEDGIFKHIFNQVAANSAQRTEIVANGNASAETQKSTILEKGVATGIVEKVLLDADSRIADNGGILMMTRSMAQALAYDMKKTYSTQLTWMTIVDGFDLTEFDGVQVARIGIWDEMIRTYENNMGRLNLPHRVVYANPQNFFVGSDAADLFTEFDTFFDRKVRTNYTYATGKLGTLIAEETLFQAAY